MDVHRSGAPSSPGHAVVVAPDAVDQLIGGLWDLGFTVLGPTIRDGVIALDEVQSRNDLPVGWGDRQGAGTYQLTRRDDESLFGYAVGPQGPRRFVHPPRRRLFACVVSDGEMVIDEPQESSRFAFFGVRPCDIAALAIQDKVWPSDDAFVVAVNCAAPAATCFCASMGTGPKATGGYDLAITEFVGRDAHRLLIEAATDRGEQLLATVAGTPATSADIAEAAGVIDRGVQRLTRSMDPGSARDTLLANPDHPRWDEVAARCLSCTNCTLVCPTCFCTAVEDSTSLDGHQAMRDERWDSCFSVAHSYLHGGGPVRPDTRSRYRQWLTHKLATWWSQFGVSGCVGCGRCITWCPAAIDLTEEVAAMADGST